MFMPEVDVMQVVATHDEQIVLLEWAKPEEDQDFLNNKCW